MQINTLVMSKVEKFGVESVYMLLFHSLKSIFKMTFELSICGTSNGPV